MFIIVWALVIAVCACAGSAVTSLQFPDLPDCTPTCTEIADGMGLFLDQAHQKEFWQ
jgi:hypothetical protein